MHGDIGEFVMAHYGGASTVGSECNITWNSQAYTYSDNFTDALNKEKIPNTTLGDGIVNEETIGHAFNIEISDWYNDVEKISVVNYLKNEPWIIRGYYVCENVNCTFDSDYRRKGYGVFASDDWICNITETTKNSYISGRAAIINY